MIEEDKIIMFDDDDTMCNCDRLNWSKCTNIEKVINNCIHLLTDSNQCNLNILI